ncbi:TniQ family protein (plasmid) [Agrobacterium tumefaciens]|uniref:TniQ family protein n=1 Tax=Agrobacterium tumefaciens TaxID=358 RepID=A0AAJ4TDF9_AGRTU|nr:TniQ family protein [Agrobacterium tumefaciens]
MTMGDAGIPTISVQPRYRNVASDQWPINVSPQPDELLSSWLHRLAYANGVAPRAFARVFGLGSGMWSPSIDLRPSSDVKNVLCANAGISHDQILEMSLTSGLPMELLLPLRNSGRRGTSTWLQFCPRCLAGDEHPYFRRSWRLATKVSCGDHRSGLRDRCPSCQRRMEAYGQSKLVPQHFCAHCGFDLRKASRVIISVAAQLVDCRIDQMCRRAIVTPEHRRVFLHDCYKFPRWL